MALLCKMTCNLRHPLRLRHFVCKISVELTFGNVEQRENLTLLRIRRCWFLFNVFEIHYAINSKWTSLLSNSKFCTTREPNTLHTATHSATHTATRCNTHCNTLFAHHAMFIVRSQLYSVLKNLLCFQNCTVDSNYLVNFE